MIAQAKFLQLRCSNALLLTYKAEYRIGNIGHEVVRIKLKANKLLHQNNSDE